MITEPTKQLTCRVTYCFGLMVLLELAGCLNARSQQTGPLKSRQGSFDGAKLFVVAVAGSTSPKTNTCKPKKETPHTCIITKTGRFSFSVLLLVSGRQKHGSCVRQTPLCASFGFPSYAEKTRLSSGIRPIARHAFECRPAMNNFYTFLGSRHKTMQ